MRDLKYLENMNFRLNQINENRHKQINELQAEVERLKLEISARDRMIDELKRYLYSTHGDCWWCKTEGMTCNIKPLLDKTPDDYKNEAAK